MSDYLQKRREFIESGRPLPEKKKYYLKKVSEKRAEKIAAAKVERGDDETEKQKWFADQRPRLSEFCGCGCGERTMKGNDEKFCFSVAHIFPQRIFKSVQFHPEVWVSRAWACHTNMDGRSMDRWPGFQDWPEIVRKFNLLSPILTPAEKSKKFYRKLEELVLASEHKVQTASVDETGAQGG